MSETDEITIYVSSGDMDNSPHYLFYTDSGSTQLLTPTNTLYLDKTYVFRRADAGSGTGHYPHPFYISDTVLAPPDSNKINVTASDNKTYNNGIRENEVLNLEFNNLTTSDTLYGYCTNHGNSNNMFEQFTLVATSPEPEPEP